MAFLELIVDIESDMVEDLTNAFMQYENVLAVSTTNQHEGTDKEEEIFIEPNFEGKNLWQDSRVTVLLPNDFNIDEVVCGIQNQLGIYFDYKVSLLEDQDWVSMTQKQFAPIKITDTFYIVPSWHDIKSDIESIILDPGLAFGTGSHPTTFMCLEWIAHNINTNISSFIDYGCGSGILAIAAKKMGANIVIATDIDKQAIESTINNANINNVELNIIMPNQINNKANIVIANILVCPLINLVDVLNDLTQDILIMSGILNSQINMIIDVYQKYFNIEIASTKEEWVLLKCQKKLQ